jgi:transcriptional regulator with XRE-family HTH domain
MATAPRRRKSAHLSPEAMAAVVTRVRDAQARLGLTNRGLAAASGVDRKTIDRLVHEDPTQRRVPGVGKVALLASALGVSSEWVLSGRGAADPSVDLTRPLTSFALELHERGLLRWAQAAPASEVPTLGEVLTALERLRAEPQLSNSAGMPVAGWSDYFAQMRSPAPAQARASKAVRATEAEQRGEASPTGVVGAALTAEMPKKLRRTKV